MLASELVDELEVLIDRHGDCPVTFVLNGKEVMEVRPYDKDGIYDGPPVEFSLAEDLS